MMRDAQTGQAYRTSEALALAVMRAGSLQVITSPEISPCPYGCGNQLEKVETLAHRGGGEVEFTSSVPYCREHGVLSPTS